MSEECNSTRLTSPAHQLCSMVCKGLSSRLGAKDTQVLCDATQLGIPRKPAVAWPPKESRASHPQATRPGSPPIYQPASQKGLGLGCSTSHQENKCKMFESGAWKGYKKARLASQPFSENAHSSFSKAGEMRV